MIVSDFRTNSLVIRATQATHKEVQQLLMLIDSPETTRGETEMIEVSKVAKENEPLLLKYANMNEVQIALNDGFLVAKGQHDSIERLRSFVEVLKKHRQDVDQKQRTFWLRVLWLSNDPDHDALNKFETDEALKKAIEKLAELGYEKMQVRMILLGRCDSLSSQRTTCQVDGTLDFGTMRHTLQVLGDFSNDGTPTLQGQLELEAIVSKSDSNPAKTSVKVGVQMEPKKYYILSAGPIGGFQSAFVVQLTENL